MRRGTLLCRLSVFMFSMCGIVLADNLFMIFIFWELVGFSSYLLIGHWCERTLASDAAKKASSSNRVGDFGFLLGIIACYWLNHTVNLTELADKGAAGGLVFQPGHPAAAFSAAPSASRRRCRCRCGCPMRWKVRRRSRRSSTPRRWVAAGIYMLCRIQVLMVPDALTVITGRHHYRAVLRDLRYHPDRHQEVLAYSTLSQLGYMVAAFGWDPCA